jgi:exopolysaccharide production protein ExoF
MRNLLFAGIFLLATLPGMTTLAAAPGDTGYRLDVGDKLKIKVFEWRSATGDVHEWTPLTGEYDVGADGAIPMPLLGSLKASGSTIDQLADAISNQLQSKLGLTIRPQALHRYRPVPAVFHPRRCQQTGRIPLSARVNRARSNQRRGRPVSGQRPGAGVERIG